MRQVIGHPPFPTCSPFHPVHISGGAPQDSPWATHGTGSQQVHESHTKQSQRCHSGIEPGELKRRGPCSTLAIATAKSAVHGVSAGGRAGGGAGCGGGGVDLVRYWVGCAARMILLTGPLASGVAAACCDALANPLDTDEVGQGERILGGVGGLSVIAEATVSEAGL